VTLLGRRQVVEIGVDLVIGNFLLGERRKSVEELIYQRAVSGSWPI
jgi:hypothetical protein